MDLYVLRHGIAVPRGTGGFARDSERPLTPKGERRLWQIAEAMEAMGLSFDHIVSSPYVRARQTAEIVAEAFRARQKVTFTQALVPGSSARSLVALLNTLKTPRDFLLLTGHEPHLSGFISLLVSGETGMALVMKKGGLCKLHTDSLRPQRCASLEWLLTPRQMSLMA